MDKKSAQKLVDKTRDDYNKIASHFSSTRSYMWPDIGKAVEKLKIKKGQKVLDIGCGNGRLYPLVEKYGVEYTGLDISKELVDIAKRDYPEAKFIVGDVSKLPFPDSHFDIVISIATLHHLPARLHHDAALEICRVLSPQGKILISVWYFWNQPKYVKEIFFNAINRIIGRSTLSFSDFYKEWRDAGGKTKVRRYFHAFTATELEKLFADKFVIAREKSDRNIIITGRKK